MSSLPMPGLFDRPLTAEDTRRAGMAQAEQTAEERHAGWKEEAVAFVHLYALAHQGFHCEDVVAFATRAGFTAPASGRAWGPVMVEAASRNMVVSMGLRKKESPGSHQTPAVWWKSLIYTPVTAVQPHMRMEAANEAVIHLAPGCLPIVLPNLSLAS